jgi:hypothetical protein
LHPYQHRIDFQVAEVLSKLVRMLAEVTVIVEQRKPIMKVIADIPYDAWPPSEFPQCSLKLCIDLGCFQMATCVFPQCQLTICMDALPRPSECNSPNTIPYIALKCVDTAGIEPKLLESYDMGSLNTTTMVTTCTLVGAIRV